LGRNNSVEDIKLFLQHYPKDSPEAAIKVQGLIDRSIANVKKHLGSLSSVYDISNISNLSRTVLSGIKKNGQLIKVIVRPSDNNIVIFFYPSELNVLDDENYELWIDDGNTPPKILTLGDILKITGIRLIPLRNLYR
jgi:hypothetical protein